MLLRKLLQVLCIRAGCTACKWYGSDPKTACMFYKGTLRSGQVFESDGSVVVLGDVNPGGKVVAKGSVIVLGSLKGNIFAG